MDFRMEEEVFRFLYIEGNAYHTIQLADRLGRSEHTFYKFYNDLKEKLTQKYPDHFIFLKKNKYAYSRFKYDSYKSARNLLIEFYRINKTQKAVELQRWVDILKLLSQHPRTKAEILDVFNEKIENKRESETQKLRQSFLRMLQRQLVNNNRQQAASTLKRFFLQQASSIEGSRKSKLEAHTDTFLANKIFPELASLPDSEEKLDKLALSMAKEVVKITGESFMDLRVLDRYLKDLMEQEVIKKIGPTSPYMYELDNSVFTSLSREELIDLYLYIHFAATTALLSVPGYLLLETLHEFLTVKYSELHLEVLMYKYSYFARVLDEYKCYQIVEAIRSRRKISLRYYTKKQVKRAHTKREDRDKPGKITILPLHLVFDHQYGRWYLIGKDERYEDSTVFKLEGITEIEMKEEGESDVFQQEAEKAGRHFQTSWLLSTLPPQQIRLRFYYDPSTSPINFVKRRVEEQGQHGCITEEGDDYFIFQITVNGTNEIKPWIRSFGSSVEVLEPESLREEIKQEWEAILKEYEM